MPPARPAVLLLHGALGAASSMLPLAERLAPHFTVHGLDFTGHGASPAPKGLLRVETLAAQVGEYVTEHGLAPAHIFGYSLGGFVALCLAASRPALVSRVATLATKLAWSPDVSAQMARQFDAATIRAKVPKLAESFAATHTGMGWEPLLDATRSMMDDLGATPRLTEDVLRSVTHPVRLAVGDRDSTVSVEETLAVMRALPAGELEVHPGTSHALERMDLDRLSRSLVAFLAR